MIMWKLNTYSSKVEQDYVVLFLTYIKKRINSKSIKTSAKLKKILTDDYIRSLLISNPSELISIHEDFIIKYGDYAKHPKLSKIFNYDYIVCKKDNSAIAFKIAQIINTRTCPYCNRAYTMMVTDTNHYIIRPDFDHFFAQSKYPLLALSLYNLIPSCLNCNRTIKGGRELDINKHLHPYLDDSDRDKWEFSYRMNGVDKYLLEIDTSKCKDNKVDETLKFLKLEEIYQKAHSDYELKDLIELNKSYGKRYIHDLITKVMKDSGLSERDVYSHLFGIEIDTHNDLNRVLNKMRRDIITKLKPITP